MDFSDPYPQGEPRRRIANLRNLPKDGFMDMAFGLGLHALGDSYAHRTETSNMFMAPKGHFLPGGSLPRSFKEFLGRGVDSIDDHPNQYSDYCIDLFRVISDRYVPSATNRELLGRLPELGKKVTAVTAQSDEDAQIRIMEGFYPDRASGYAPESDNESISLMPPRLIFWEDFCKRQGGKVSQQMLTRIQQLADDWT